MNLRGPVVSVDETRTVETGSGTAELCEVSLEPDRGTATPVTVTLWNKWTETGDVLQPGMELAVYDASEREYRGERQYATQAETRVVVEPDFLVDVTDLRAWVQCPRMYYLNKIGGTPLAEPVVTGTIVHDVFGDLLRGREVEAAVSARVEEAGLELGLLGVDADSITDTVQDHARAIQGWLDQGTLTEPDEWRSEQTLLSERYGLKGRADAVRRGMPVELKTGKNTTREPRFQDKVQAVCYAILLGEQQGEPPEMGTLLYTKNATVDRAEMDGDLSPAKEFTIGRGLRNFVLRARNELAAIEYETGVPTGYEGDATCDYCFEQDTCLAVSGLLDQESKAGQIGEPLPAHEREYFDSFYRAIEAERRAVHREFSRLWTESAEERAANDRALVGLTPTKTSQLPGGRWELRTQGTGAVSKIREGDLVLASDGDPAGGQAELARVERIDPQIDDTEATGQEIVVTTDERIDLRRLDVYPSELSTDRLLTALHDAVLRRPASAKAVLFERREPTFEPVEETFLPSNESQDRAVRKAVGAADCALIHGPPGTGKTHTLARVVRALIDRDQRVLLSAFTNRAVDNAIEALEAQGCTDLVRIGTKSGVSESAQPYRLRRAGDPTSRATALETAPIVAATTASCGSRIMREQSFDVAIVDEAAQLTEPATLAATALADRFVLVGDHHQLPPVVQADTGADATVADLSRSLFERLVDTYPDAAVRLNRQYRMAQRIQAFPSAEFYDGTLRPADGSVASQHVDDIDGVDSSALPEHLRDRVVFVDPDGEATGNTNPAEATAAAETVQAYRAAGVPADAIGVIAPFRAQVAAIQHRTPDAVTVDTVDRFQGSSKAVIVISFVATGSLDGPIFEDYRRVNVALTRAKNALVIIADTAALQSDDTYRRLLEWAR